MRARLSFTRDNMRQTVFGRVNERNAMCIHLKNLSLVGQLILAAVVHPLLMTELLADEKQVAKGVRETHHYFHKEEKQHEAEWSYEGARGPSMWGNLCPAYKLAKTGKEQSPIDISDATKANLPKLVFDYKPAKIDLVYNGHTIQETEEAGSCFEIEAHRYELKQFHFHSPSEHTIDGEHFAMEMHLVHKDAHGGVSVVAVMIQVGEENRAFDPIWNYLPTEKNKELRYAAKIDATQLLPKDRSYFQYMGSFTTPPCTESVRWFVLRTPIDLSKRQIEKFRAIVSGNNRPVQPLNDREIKKSE